MELRTAVGGSSFEAALPIEEDIQPSVSGRKPHEQRYVHVSSNSDRGGTKTTWASRPRVSSTR